MPEPDLLTFDPGKKRRRQAFCGPNLVNGLGLFVEPRHVQILDSKSPTHRRSLSAGGLRSLSGFWDAADADGRPWNWKVEISPQGNTWWDARTWSLVEGASALGRVMHAHRKFVTGEQEQATGESTQHTGDGGAARRKIETPGNILDSRAGPLTPVYPSTGLQREQ